MGFMANHGKKNICFQSKAAKKFALILAVSHQDLINPERITENSGRVNKRNNHHKSLVQSRFQTKTKATTLTNHKRLRQLSELITI